MYNPKELQRRAQLNVMGVDNSAHTSLVGNAPQTKPYEFGRGLATIGDVAVNVLKGATKTLEGLFDAGAMLVGLFGVDVDDLVAYDWTSDVFGEDGEKGRHNWTWGEDLTNASLLKEDSFINQVAEGVGGMLPSIALNFIPGVGTALSTASFIGSAGGSASEQALNEGASYGQALGYGVIRGGIEGITERIGGRVFGKATELSDTLLGRGLQKLGADKIFGSGVGKAVYNFASEGLEEVVADVLDIPTRMLTGMSNEENFNKDFKDYLGTFVTGGTVGVLLDGLQKGGSAIFNKTKGGSKYVKVAEDMKSLADNTKALALLQQNKKVSQDQLNKATKKLAERDLGILEDMSKQFQNMTESQREEAFTTLSVDAPMIVDMFESNGKLKETVNQSYNEVITQGERYNVSSNLMGNTKDIQKNLDEINEEKGFDLQISNTQYEGVERENFAKISKAINGLSKKSGTTLNLVAIKDNNNANAFIRNNTIYVSDGRLKDGTWAKEVAHEVTHFTEKTKDFMDFGEFILADENLKQSAISKVLSKSNYGYTAEQIETAFNNLETNGKLEGKDLEIYQEVVAHATEDILGNEEAINKLARENKTWTQKLLNRIKDFLSALKGTNADSGTIERLTKAEELFEKALKQAGVDSKVKDLKNAQLRANYLKDKQEYLELAEEDKAKWLEEKGYTAEDFDSDVLDNSGETRYSLIEKKFTESDYETLKSKVMTKNSEHRGRYPIDYDTTANHFVVYKNNGYNNIKVIKAFDIDVYYDVLSKLEENIKNGKIYRDAKSLRTDISRFRNAKRRNSNSNVVVAERKSNGKDGGLYRIKSQIDTKQNNRKSSGNKQNLKFSYTSPKDSQGNTLTKEQEEFFKDSKVRNDKGELEVVYHGTVGEFHTFDKTYLGMATGMSDAKLGFFFTNNKNVATEYAINAHDTKFFNLAYKIANGDESILRKLSVLNGYKELAMTEDVKAFAKLEEKGERFEHDVLEVYLNIKNPLIDDWHGLTYKKAKMLKLVTRAITGNYDGVIIKNIDDSYDHDGQVSDVYIIFEPNQVKYITNKNPSTVNDMRFSYKTNSYEFEKENQNNLKNSSDSNKISTTSTDGRFNYLVSSAKLSESEVAKKVANYSRAKVFSKTDAEKVVNDIIDSIELEGKTISLAGKNFDEAVNAVWISWNSQNIINRVKTARKIARYILEQSVAEDIYFDEENLPYIETIEMLKPYFHSIDLSAIKEDIDHTYGKGNVSLWSAGKNKGQTADNVAMELTSMGYPINADSEMEAFKEIKDRYDEAKNHLNRQRKEALSKLYTKDQLFDLEYQIANELVESYNTNGKASQFLEITTYNKNANRLSYELKKLADIKQFRNATQYDKEKMFEHNILKLKSIEWRGNITKGARSIVGNLATWYNEANPILQNKYVADIKTILEDIAQGEGKLTTTEVKDLADVVFMFRKLINDYYRVFRNGKYEDALPIAEKYVKIEEDNQDIKVGVAVNLFSGRYAKGTSYFEMFADPMSVARVMDRYDDGFNTAMLEEFRQASVNAEVLKMDLFKPIETFFKKHKNYDKQLTKSKVIYQGAEITKDKALYLYMALNDKDAIRGVAESGISTYDEKGYLEYRIAGFNNDPNATMEELEAQAKEIQENLKKQFTEEDKEFIKIAEKLFNEDCRNLKYERDMQRLGYSNIKEGYYCPIRRAWIYKSADSNTVQYEMDRVSNASFNKERSKNAKNELLVEPLSIVLNRHIKGVAQYYAMSNAIDNYNALYNLDINNNPNSVVSVKTARAKSWGKKGDAFFDNLITDMQGIKEANSGVFARIRGSYAKFQLGANPKVWITQLSSFFASTNILDYSSVVKGWFVGKTDLDKYCRLAELRNHDNTVALAEGVMDKIDKVGNILTKPIGMMDRLVIRGLWGACQVQIAKKGKGFEIGTEANKVEAGKLLEKVILETQQNSLATERSQAMRSENEIMKTFTMFSSDAMKVTGRFIDATLKIQTLKAKRKVATNQAEIDAINKELKSARKDLAKSSTAIILSSMFMMAVAKAFKWLLDQDEEDENVLGNMLVDFFGNLLGGLPIWKNLYSSLFEGYDTEIITTQSLNDVFGAVEAFVNIAVDIGKGKATTQDITKASKDISFAIGQVFGIPTRNILKYFTGLSKRFAPEFGYQVESLFYTQNLSKDLKSAIAKQDEDMIETVASVILNERVGKLSDNTRKEFTRLMGIDLDGNGKGDYNVLPTSVGKTITVNDVQYSLEEGTLKKDFKEVYYQANAEVDKLITSAKYQKLSDKAKAKAINTLYNYYYYKAQAEVLGIEQDKKIYLFSEIVPIDQLTYAIAYAQDIKDNKKITYKKELIQKYVQSLKLSAINKKFVMAYLGYKNTDSESLFKSVINRTSLTKAQKESLIKSCGY